jgi:hypothetical protein
MKDEPNKNPKTKTNTPMKKSKDYTLVLILFIGILLFAIEYTFQHGLNSKDDIQKCNCILDDDE